MPENDVRFLETAIESSSTFIEKYKKQISIPYDDFLEDFIIESQFYSIELGLTPVAGCWYYNRESRLTLESAGYITKSKLLRVIL
jgi:hypothetical protein